MQSLKGTGCSVSIVSSSEPLCGPSFQALISTHGGCPAEHGGAPVRGDVSVNVRVQGKCEDWCPACYHSAISASLGHGPGIDYGYW